MVSVGIGSNHKSKAVRLHPVALVDNFNPKRVKANRSGIAVNDAQTKRARQIKIPVDITYFKCACACMQNGSSGVRTLPNRQKSKNLRKSTGVYYFLTFVALKRGI